MCFDDSCKNAWSSYWPHISLPFPQFKSRIKEDKMQGNCREMERTENEK